MISAGAPSAYAPLNSGYYDQRRVVKRRVDKQRVDKQRVDKRRVDNKRRVVTNVGYITNAG